MKKLSSVLKSAGVRVNNQPAGTSTNIMVVPITGKVKQNAECWNVACSNGSC